MKANDEEMECRTKKAEITFDWVLHDIRSITDSKEEQVRDRLKAYELLGKYLKMFTKKQEIIGTNSSSTQFMFVNPDDDV